MKKVYFSISIFVGLFGLAGVALAYTHQSTPQIGYVLLAGGVLMAFAAGMLVVWEMLFEEKKAPYKSSLTPEQQKQVEEWGCSPENWNKVVDQHNVELLAKHHNLTPDDVRRIGAIMNQGN